MMKKSYFSTLKGKRWIKSRRKRLLDLSLCAIMLPFACATLLLLLPLLIAAGKPFFFSQKRTGRNSRVFTIHKLRSMTIDTQKVTKLGSFLRVTSFDEIPQLLINVWNGSMTIIGPRPLAMEDIYLMRRDLSNKEFEQWYSAHTFPRPGWMSAFSFPSRSHTHRSALYQQTRYKHDIAYIENASFSVDLAIYLRNLFIWYIPLRRALQTKLAGPQELQAEPLKTKPLTQKTTQLRQPLLPNRQPVE